MYRQFCCYNKQINLQVRPTHFRGDLSYDILLARVKLFYGVGLAVTDHDLAQHCPVFPAMQLMQIKDHLRLKSLHDLHLICCVSLLVSTPQMPTIPLSSSHASSVLALFQCDGVSQCSSTIRPDAHIFSDSKCLKFVPSRSDPTS